RELGAAQQHAVKASCFHAAHDPLQVGDWFRPEDPGNQLLEDDAIDFGACFQRVMGRMKDEGVDAVVLGCTEIPLIMNDANSPLPTLDSTRLLARAALQRA